MKSDAKTITVAGISIVFALLIGAYLSNIGTVNALKKAFAEVQATNLVGSVESWDQVEKLLAGGCNKKALELVKIEQTLGLSEIRHLIGNDNELAGKVKERNPKIAARAKVIPGTTTYPIPTCD